VTGRWQRPSSAERGERRVVVTGMGAITPIGNDVPSYWASLVAGRSWIDCITSFDPSRLDARIAGEVKDFQPELVMP
jgi:3-oxoacyl-[acyl-carrier-protein] synthase II